MIGLVLALVLVALVMTLLGLWIFSIPIGIVALVLFVLFLAGWGRRGARTPHTPAQPLPSRCFIWRNGAAIRAFTFLPPTTRCGPGSASLGPAPPPFPPPAGPA